jgi:thioredoxin-related protein
MAPRILVILLFCFTLCHDVGAQGDFAIPAPVDLTRDARQATREGKPIVILFALPGCPFCETVRQNYLAPLLRDLPLKERPIIREIEIDSPRTFAGFKGELSSHRSLAKSFNIRLAPTVVFLDPAGQLLTQPIVGGDSAGMYGGYLENAFAEAAQKLSATRRTDKKGDQP